MVCCVWVVCGECVGSVLDEQVCCVWVVCWVVCCVWVVCGQCGQCVGRGGVLGVGSVDRVWVC